MTESGRKACPDLNAKFEIMPEIITAFKKTPFGMGELSGYAVTLPAGEDRQYPQGKIKA